MSVSQPTPNVSQMTGAQAVVDSLVRHGITAGFGIPSIHNIAVYEALRQAPGFHHWVVRHEQAAGYAADGFYRRSGQIAAIFASTGPGNLFTLVPLLESLQNNIPVLLIGTNIASAMLSKTGGALHETPEQLEIIRPLTRFARRVPSPDALSVTIAEAVTVLRGSLPGPAFIEVPHDFFLAPVSADFSGSPMQNGNSPQSSPGAEIEDARRHIAESRTPTILVGAGVRDSGGAVRQFAEVLQSPVFTTTSGKGVFAGDHPLSLGCISRLAGVQEVFQQSDLLISFGARLTEFDTGRFGMQLPPRHIQVVEDARYPGDRIPSTQVVDKIGATAQALGQGTTRAPWCDIAAIKVREAKTLEALGQDSYAALKLLRDAMHRNDVLVNDQSILNYWASAFFPVLEPGTFLYPSGSGTLGYALPAAIGAACAVKRSSETRQIVCIAGDGGFQYTQHELATLAQYDLPVKILLVNDDSYGVIAFLQRTMFGQTHEVALKNPDFCRVAEAYGIRAERITSVDALEQRIPQWLSAPGPALLEWHTQLKAPWEVGAIPRPTGIAQKSS